MIISYCHSLRRTAAVMGIAIMIAGCSSATAPSLPSRMSASDRDDLLRVRCSIASTVVRDEELRLTIRIGGHKDVVWRYVSPVYVACVPGYFVLRLGPRSDGSNRAQRQKPTPVRLIELEPGSSSFSLVLRWEHPVMSSREQALVPLGELWPVVLIKGEESDVPLRIPRNSHCGSPRDYQTFRVEIGVAGRDAIQGEGDGDESERDAWTRMLGTMYCTTAGATGHGH